MLKRLALQWISLLGWSSINEELRQNLLDVVSITPPLYYTNWWSSLPLNDF